MVIGQNSIAIRYYDLNSEVFIPIDKVLILDEPIKYLKLSNQNKKKSSKHVDKDIFNRHILAFGEDGQELISDLVVTIVGLGGVGSIIVEGLCRLGVKTLVLVDYDKLEITNLNRFQGGKYSDIGEYKVDICKKNMLQAFPGIEISACHLDLFTNEAVKSIKTSDCIIGCLDNAESRYFINRLSLQFLIPYIDAGVLIKNDVNNVTGLLSRVAIVIPGHTRCLNCSEIKYYDEKKAREYFLDLGTRESLTRSGYIENFNEIKSPAVYPLNLNVSSYILFEFLNLFTGYKPIYWNIVNDYLNMNQKTIALNTMDNYEPYNNSCMTCELYKATGDHEKLNYFYGRNKKIKLPDI